MKAIKITEQNKVNFKNIEVGNWYIGQIPKVFIVGNQQIFGYESREDLHELDGWKDLVQPTIGEHQKRTNQIIESENSVTYAFVDMTEEEIDDLIPSQISKLNFKIGLLTNHGITNSQVQAFFDTLEDEMFKAKLELLWFESSFFERKDPNLVAFAPQLGLSINDLNTIFVNFNGY